MDNHMLDGFINETKTDEPVYFSKVRLADKKIEIETRNKKVLAFCKEYLDKYDCPDFVVRATNEEIESNYKANHPDYQQLLDESIEATVDYTIAETNVIYRKIAEAMLEYDTLLMHGAAIAVNKKCYVFTAPSGTGKTTHINNWIKCIPGTIVVNGDKPLINVHTKIVYGTPWCGKERKNTNTSATLAGIIILERGVTNSLKPISFSDMIPTLLQQVYISKEKEKKIKTYKLLSLLESIPCYKLKCNMDVESARIAYDGIKENERKK